MGKDDKSEINYHLLIKFENLNIISEYSHTGNT